MRWSWRVAVAMLEASTKGVWLEESGSSLASDGPFK